MVGGADRVGEQPHTREAGCSVKPRLRERASQGLRLRWMEVIQKTGNKPICGEGKVEAITGKEVEGVGEEPSMNWDLVRRAIHSLPDCVPGYRGSLLDAVEQQQDVGGDCGHKEFGNERGPETPQRTRGGQTDMFCCAPDSEPGEDEPVEGSVFSMRISWGGQPDQRSIVEDTAENPLHHGKRLVP